jgi:hypothetical protein
MKQRNEIKTIITKKENTETERYKQYRTKNRTKHRTTIMNDEDNKYG